MSCQTFQGVAKLFMELPDFSRSCQTFQGGAKLFKELRCQTCQGELPNFSGRVAKLFREWPNFLGSCQTVQGVATIFRELPNISGSGQPWPGERLTLSASSPMMTGTPEHFSRWRHQALYSRIAKLVNELANISRSSQTRSGSAKLI